MAATLILVALAVLGCMAALNRESIGLPMLPDQVSRLFDRSDPGLPPGLNYDLSMVDPPSQSPLGYLPQLGTVEIRLAVTNDTSLPMVLDFPTSLQCEFVVRRIYRFMGGWFSVPLEVWRSSYFHNYAKTPTQLRLAPGQTKVYIAYWTVNGLTQLQVPPGSYGVYTSFSGIKPLFIEKPL